MRRIKSTAYDEKLANRVRDILVDQKVVEEKKGMGNKKDLNHWINLALDFNKKVKASKKKK